MWIQKKHFTLNTHVGWHRLRAAAAHVLGGDKCRAAVEKGPPKHGKVQHPAL
jgi:hypothetical protein